MRAAWWWIDRWRKSTAYTDMTLAEQGAYRNLLDELWLREGALPDDERILAKLCGDAMEWPKVRKAVMARFVRSGRGWTHPTHDEVSAQSRSFRDAQADAGRARAAQASRDAIGRLQPARPAGWDSARQPPSPSPSPSPSQAVLSTEPAADKPLRAAKPRKRAEGPNADLIRHWEFEWPRTRLGAPWAWTPKEAVGVANALKLAQGDVGEVRQRMTRLLESPDSWLASNASPSILCSRWNQLAVTIDKNGGSNLLNRLLAQAETRQ